MTTIIGISGYDPNKNQEYILIATDSRVSFNWGKGFGIDVLSDNAEKIIFNQETSLILSYDGTQLKSDGPLEKQVKNLESKLYQNKEEIFQDLEMINKEEDHSYVFATKCNDSLDLNCLFKRYQEKKSRFFRRKVTKIADNERHEKIKRVVIGSGAQYFSQKIKKKFEKIGIEENRYVSTLKEIILPIIDSFKEISNKDIYTGGKINLGILTKSNIIKLSDIYDLNQNKMKIELEKIMDW